MIAVIIAGGSGTRLWPLSTPDYPKHLLKVNGEERSLLQKTYDRTKKITDKVYVITDVSHAHHVRDQLPQLTDETCIVEPARRGTTNCTASALAALSGKHNPDEAVFILWADHYIRDEEGFVHTINMATAVAEREKRIMLVGVEPDYPATGFGYIQKDTIFDEETFIHNVHSFKEKPNHETAKKYLKTGNYLWNSGYLIGTTNVLIDAMREYAPAMLQNYERLRDAASREEFTEIYTSFESSNIDNAFTEKVAGLLVVRANFDWMDLGSYSDLYKASELDQCGNHINGPAVETEGVENSFIHNYEDKPIAVVGLDNIVVINTPNGILVSRKDLSQKIGEVSKRIGKS